MTTTFIERRPICSTRSKGTMGDTDQGRVKEALVIITHGFTNSHFFSLSHRSGVAKVGYDG